MESKLWNFKILEVITEFVPKLFAAIVIWVIGTWLIGLFLKGFKKILNKGDYDKSLKSFLNSLANWILKLVLVILVLGTIGVQTTSFAAVLAAAGLAIGLALQGALGNFAGGVLIMIFRPFKIGDFIEAQDVLGTVKEIKIFTTTLVGETNRELIVPNGALSNGTIINHTSQDIRRVDLLYGVAYDTNIKKTKATLMAVLIAHPKVLDEPSPEVSVLELTDGSINFGIRPWCHATVYWDVYSEITEQIKIALDTAQIQITYPPLIEA